jgi:hypothetical protein
MLHHAAYAVDPEVLHELLDAWSATRAAGSNGPLDEALEKAAARRRERASLVRVELGDAEARALAKDATRALEEHLAIALTASRPLEDVQRLRRFAERSARARELQGPTFLLGDIGASVVEIVHAWRCDEALHAAAKEGRARPRDLRWLPLEIVSVATAIGQDEIGLGDEVDALAIAQDFRDRYPSAGSFWDVHGTGGPEDELQRYPHPIWNESPLALPTSLEAGGAPVRVSELAGVVSYADAASIARYAIDADPAVREFAGRVGAAVNAGCAVLSWIEAS